MELDLYKLEFEEQASKAIDNFEKALAKISVSGANPELFKNLEINYFDTKTPLIDLCSITHPEPQQLLIKPYDKKIVSQMISTIEKQNYSISLQDEGHQIRIIFPILTTQRRSEEVKKISKIKEESKIKIRNARQNAMKGIKNDKELSEDEQKQYQNQIQEMVDKKILEIDNLSQEKEKQIMKL